MPLDKDQLLKEIEITTSRSSGAGGQNVNKVETKVNIKYDLVNTNALDQEEIAKLLVRLANKLIGEQYITIQSQAARTQLKNKDIAINKLVAALETALIDQKPRKKSRPSASSINKRLRAKQIRSEVKENRRFRLD